MATDSAPTVSVGQRTLIALISFSTNQHLIRIEKVQLVQDINDYILSVKKFNSQFHTSINLNSNNGSIYSRKMKTKIALIRMKDNLYRLPAKIYTDNDGLKSLEIRTLQFNSILILSNKFSEKFSVPSCFLENTNKDSCVIANSRKTTRTKSRRLRKTLSPEKLHLLESEGKLLHNRFAHISTSYLYKL